MDQGNVQREAVLRELVAHFGRLDRGHTGLIQRKCLATVLSKLCPGVDADWMLDRAGAPAEGLVNYARVLDWLYDSWDSQSSAAELAVAEARAALLTLAEAENVTLRKALEQAKVAGVGAKALSRAAAMVEELELAAMHEAVQEEMRSERGALTSSSLAYFSSEDSLRHELEGGHVVLIKGDWLVQLYSDGGILPRRQDLPPEAVWKVEERPWEATIIAISYCWATASHPDPKGEQLHNFLGPMLKNFLGRKMDETGTWEKEVVTGKKREAAVFLDWCSLPQEPRSKSDMESFKLSLANINIWYIHQSTVVWMLTQVPEGVLEYDLRGWPVFERAVSSMIKASWKALDFAPLCGDWEKSMTYYQTGSKNVVDLCRAARSPPIHPEQFARILFSKRFTNGADKVFVSRKYAQTFLDVMSRVDKLQWSDASFGELERLGHVSRALSLCTALLELDLSCNRIADVSPLAMGLSNSSTLQSLVLRMNRVADVSPMARLLSLRTLRTLDLSWNRIVSFSPLADALSAEGALETLNLSWNRITRVEIKAPASIVDSRLSCLDLRCNLIANWGDSWLPGRCRSVSILDRVVRWNPQVPMHTSPERMQLRCLVPKPFPGVQYRRSKDLNNRWPRFIQEGSSVCGFPEFDEDTDWLRVDDNIFLPLRIGALQLFEPLPGPLPTPERLQG